MKRIAKIFIVLLVLAMAVTCLVACGHSHTYDKQITTENYLFSTATCTQKARYHYSCDCGEKGTQTFEYGEALGHSWGEYVSDNNATYTADGTKTATCTRTDCGATDNVTDVGTKLSSGISFGTFTVVDNTVNGGVMPYAQSTFDFNQEIDVIGNATYDVCIDQYGLNDYASKTVPLVEGVNTFYVFEKVGGVLVNTYTVTIYRHHLYTVTFDTLGGSEVVSQQVEEGALLSTTVIPTKVGYTFAGWDYDFSTPVTSSKTVTAEWSANTDTAYKVEYYLENVENDNYTLMSSETENLTGTTGVTVYATIKEFDYFTPESTYVSGAIAPDGLTILRVYYQRNESLVTFVGDGGTLTSGNATQSIKYGGSAIAPTFAKTGYTFTGFDREYDNITEPITVTAEWSINQYTLTIVYGNGQEDIKITQDYGTTIPIIDNPMVNKGGYDFAGWDKDIPTTMPAKDVTVNAQWSPIFYRDGGTITGFTTYGRHENYTEIIFPSLIDGVEMTAIGEFAFYNCDSLTSITIPDSVTSIGESAFSGCSSLTSITIPDSVKSIGWGAFEDCTSLNKVNFLGTIDQWVEIEFSNWSSNPLLSANNLYIKDVLVEDVVLTTATKISDYAFEICTSLTSITIPDNVTSIGDEAFCGCSSLESVTFGENSQLESIGSYAFVSCTSLTSITIPDSVTSIGSYAFSGCTSLTIYCEAESKPSGWNTNWNYSNCTVVWGYKG